ncbi:lysophospholipid acyltransferase family protein, partial [Malikia sp.]|uniref:lysophospholipid acyltransferase family protein n=1 Tax=Malikia sp. TaxID=2070706 RepID=UPI002A4C6802|nr:1-acyl-sn-glycerol-3-phosphate acyltransferase [Malikia sp.]
MSALRSLLHLLFMAVTVIPWSLAVVLARPFASKTSIYWMCQRWLKLSVDSARWIIGIRYQVLGREHLPQGSSDPAVLLVKHQSTWETFAMPAIMPHPLAYVFKKELLRVPFFGWAIG